MAKQISTKYHRTTFHAIKFRKQFSRFSISGSSSVLNESAVADRSFDLRCKSFASQTFIVRNNTFCHSRTTIQAVLKQQCIWFLETLNVYKTNDLVDFNGVEIYCQGQHSEQLFFTHTERGWITRTSVHKVISSWKDKNKIWDEILSFKV